MIDITLGQTYEAKNLLTLRKKMSQFEIQSYMIGIENYINNSGLKKIGAPITTTYSFENGVIDFEIMIPVDTDSLEHDEYYIKPLFKMVNALKASHYGNPSNMAETFKEIAYYIETHKLHQITAPYNVAIREAKTMEELDSVVADIYIGINPSIL